MPYPPTPLTQHVVAYTALTSLVAGLLNPEGGDESNDLLRFSLSMQEEDTVNHNIMQ